MRIHIDTKNTDYKTEKWIITSLSLSMLLSSLGTSIANVALPTLAIEFSISVQAVQWVVLSYLLSITILIVGIGKLGDILGRKRIFLTGISLLTIASVLCGIATTFTMLIIARAIQGIGAAILMVLTLALVRDLVVKSKIGRAMGLMGTMSALGTAMGPSLGGVVIESFGWRFIFYLMVPIGILSFFLPNNIFQMTKERKILILKHLIGWAHFYWGWL